MTIFGTLLLLLLAFGLVSLFRFVPRLRSYAWLTAASGSLLAWGSVFLWQFSIPWQATLGPWLPLSLFDISPQLYADSFSWLYSLSLTGLSAAVIFASTAQQEPVSPLTWAGILLLLVVALLALLADTIPALVIAWTAIDLVEFINAARAAPSPRSAERVVVAFTLRGLGTGLGMAAGALAATEAEVGLLENLPPSASLLLLFAVGLRMGVLPLHLPYHQDPILRRGFGTMLRLTTSATALAVLPRLPLQSLQGQIPLLLLSLSALAALYAAWKWLTLRDALEARPYWLIGMSALSLAAALRGNPAGSAAWGSALILLGGAAFLYSAQNLWLTRLLLFSLLLVLGLPFSITATGWLAPFPLPFLFLPAFFLAHLMLSLGYARYLLRAPESPLAEMPRWVQAAYPAGFAPLVLTALIGGVWGWEGSLQLGNLGFAAASIFVLALLSLAYFRFRQVLQPVSQLQQTGEQFISRASRFLNLQDALAGALWALYRWLGRLVSYFSQLLEGDGGLLWTFIFLILLISILRGS
jgi:hypothetical protein